MQIFMSSATPRANVWSGSLTRRQRGRIRRRPLMVLAVLLIALTQALPVAAASDGSEAVVEAIERYLAAELETSAIPGAAVAVTRGDRVLLLRGYGHDSTGAPITGQSLFRIASLSKSFTALAVMQLVDAGRLELDDPVQQHLPEYHLADPRAGQVTVRQLLDHTSGLSDALVPDLSRPQPATLTEATTSLRSARLASAPGTTYSYNNPNYQVAARLVEVVSGEPFNEYLRRHVLEPTGMATSTSTVTDDEPVAGLPQGHVIAYGRAVPASGLGTFTVGEGGVVSSAADMARWLTLHANGGMAADGTQVVSRRGMRLLHTPSAPHVGYALGWDTDGPIEAPTRLEHSGNLLTYSSEQAIWPQSGYGVVLLFNSGSGFLLDQIAIAHGVFDIIEGTRPPASGRPLSTTLDAVLAVLTVTALTMAACGVRRARAWARRRRGSPLRVVLGSLPSAVVLCVGAAFVRIAESLIGRDVTWRSAAYGWPALAAFVMASVLAAAATLLTRFWWLGHSSRKSPTHHRPEAHLVSRLTPAHRGSRF